MSNVHGVRGFVSTDNSTSETLTLDTDDYTGTWEDVVDYASISLSVTTSLDATIWAEFSSDGVTADRTIQLSKSPTTHSGIHSLIPVNQYFRVFIENATALNVVEVQTMYHTSARIAQPTSRLGQNVQIYSDLLNVRPLTNIDLELARQHIVGQSADFFFGHNEAITNAGFEDVWAPGGDIPWQTSAVQISVASSDAADTATGPGLGCQSVEIHGLSATGADQSEVIDLNGTTEAHSTLTYTRVNLMHNEEVGTYGGSHQGDITCRVYSAGAGTGAILSLMEGLEGAVDTSVQYGYGEAMNGFTSVPLGKVLYITRLSVKPQSSKPIDVVLYERDGLLTTSDPFQPRRVLWIADELDAPIEKEFKSHIKIKALSDIFFRAQASTASASAVDVWLDYYLLDEDSDGA